MPVFGGHEIYAASRRHKAIIYLAIVYIYQYDCPISSCERGLGVNLGGIMTGECVHEYNAASTGQESDIL